MAKSHKVRQTGTMSLPAEYIAQSILFLRGQRVILDRQLAAIYGVETRTLNQAVTQQRALPGGLHVPAQPGRG